jgi:hypothetical protein
VVAAAIWIVKPVTSNAPKTVKTLFRILVSMERVLLKDNRTRLVRRPVRSDLNGKLIMGSLGQSACGNLL